MPVFMRLANERSTSKAWFGFELLTTRPLSVAVPLTCSWKLPLVFSNT